MTLFLRKRIFIFYNFVKEHVRLVVSSPLSSNTTCFYTSNSEFGKNIISPPHFKVRDCCSIENKNIGSFDHYIQLTVKDVKTNWTKRAKHRDTCPLLTRKRDSHRSKYYFTLFVP